MKYVNIGFKLYLNINPDKIKHYLNKFIINI